MTTPPGQTPGFRGNLAYLHGGYENIFPKVEAALEGRAVGFATTLDLAVEDAFGARDESLVRTIPKEPSSARREGGRPAAGVGGDGQPAVFNVVKIKGPECIWTATTPGGPGAEVQLQGHRRAAATAEEIAHRHVHGAHGHQH